MNARLGALVFAPVLAAVIIPLALLTGPAGTASALPMATKKPTPTPTSTPPAGAYYTGDFKTSLNLYSFNVNINAWVKNRKGAPPLDTLSAIKWAKQAGFDAVNVPMYYVPGYSGTSMPTNSTDSIKSFVASIKSTAAQQGLAISATGIGNDFAQA